jgi:NAD(P)-dependent dehydrogenase (short-subunit alcohol dehydrogenase family)
MAGPLASKVVIVTGGASGIGRAVAGRIVSDGGAVVIAGRRRDAGERAAEQLRAGGGRALFVATDVTVERDAERLAATAVTEFGRLDGAVNNAGGVSAAGPVHTIGAAAWHAELEQNLTSVFHCLKFQIPAMIASAGGGSIINNASTGGVRGDTRPGGVRGRQARGGRPYPFGRAGVRGPRRAGQRAGHRQRRYAADEVDLGPEGVAARAPVHEHPEERELVGIEGVLPGREHPHDLPLVHEHGHGVGLDDGPGELADVVVGPFVDDLALRAVGRRDEFAACLVENAHRIAPP